MREMGPSFVTVAAQGFYRSRVRNCYPLPYWVTKIDTLTWNPWEIRGFSVFMPCFFKACFIDTQGHSRALGRTWTKFSADLACFMVGFTLLDTFYCSSFLNNLKLFIEEVGIIFWYQPLFSLFWKYEHNPHLAFNSEYQPASIWGRKLQRLLKTLYWFFCARWYNRHIPKTKEESVHAKTATVPSDLWRTTSR